MEFIGAGTVAQAPVAARAPSRMQRRSYQAAQVSRLTSDWIAGPTTADQEVHAALRTVRARTRDLYRNSDYVRKFARMVESNVVGPQGVIMQAQVSERDGRPDAGANRIIEEAWWRWCEAHHADAGGRLSWCDIQQLFIRTVALDGECFLRLVRGYPNPYGFALQLIEADRIDENHNAILEGGREIRMGIELDAWGRAIAYHVRTRPPGVHGYYSGAGAATERVPASEILHGYIVDRVDQTRGMPWPHTAIQRLRNLGGYEEAELIAARIAASKMGFYMRSGDGAGVLVGDDKDESGNLIQEAAPGMFEELPLGYDFKEWNPDHPAGNFGNFVKSCLRGIASGLGVAYTSLANDLEGVNFSSIRSGLLEERDQWRCLQWWLIRKLHERVREAWLEMAMLRGALNLPMAKFEKFNAARWQPRGWAWVDPKKDIEANIAAVNAGFKTRTQVLAESGDDIEETFEQLAKEKQLAAQHGLTFTAEKPAAPPAKDDEDEE